MLPISAGSPCPRRYPLQLADATAARVWPIAEGDAIKIARNGVDRGREDTVGR